MHMEVSVMAQAASLETAEHGLPGEHGSNKNTVENTYGIPTGCTAPLCTLGWVKCREHISLLIILCIIVYVTNKAHLSLICVVVVTGSLIWALASHQISRIHWLKGLKGVVRSATSRHRSAGGLDRVCPVRELSGE